MTRGDPTVSYLDETISYTVSGDEMTFEDLMAMLYGERVPPPLLATVDPGDDHAGLCVWDLPAGDLLAFAEQTPEETIGALETVIRPSLIVVERFGVYPESIDFLAHSEMQTSEMIGAIKDAARRRGVRVIGQAAAVKGIAARTPRGRAVLGEIRGDGARSQHVEDAGMHGVYFFHQSSYGPQISMWRWRGAPQGP